MSSAAYVKKVAVSVDGSTNWLEVPTQSPSLDLGGDVLDETVLNAGTGNTGWRSRALGLHDWSVKCDSLYIQGNAALAAIRAAKLARSALYVRYCPTGVTAEGFKGACVVENFNLSGSFDGQEEVSITLQANGALEAAA